MFNIYLTSSINPLLVLPGQLLIKTKDILWNYMIYTGWDIRIFTPSTTLLGSGGVNILLPQPVIDAKFESIARFTCYYELALPPPRDWGLGWGMGHSKKNSTFIYRFRDSILVMLIVRSLEVMLELLLCLLFRNVLPRLNFPLINLMLWPQESRYSFKL